MAESIKKIIKVTLDATKTIVIANSSTTVDVTNNTLLSDGHGFKTGDVVDAVATSGALPTGISAATAYYVRVLSHDKFYLYDTLAHAIALTATTGIIDISATGSGNSTYRKNAYGTVLLGESLPIGAIVTDVISNEITAFDSAADAATATLTNGTDSISASLTLDTDVSGLKEFSYDGTTTAKLGTLVITAATELRFVVATAVLTDGKADFFIEYIY